MSLIYNLLIFKFKYYFINLRAILDALMVNVYQLVKNVMDKLTVQIIVMRMNVIHVLLVIVMTFTVMGPIIVYHR